MGYVKRNRTDAGVNPEKASLTAMQESELVLKLNKGELFDQHVLLPHAELNKLVYLNVNSFVEKYRGEEMTLSICTESVSPVIQNVFRETYHSHYQDEYQKVNRYIKRHRIRAVVLLIVSIAAFILSSQLEKILPGETIFTYVIGNISCFSLWEVGYTQFASRDTVLERKRISRALNAKIEFQ